MVHHGIKSIGESQCVSPMMLCIWSQTQGTERRNFKRVEGRDETDETHNGAPASCE